MVPFFVCLFVLLVMAMNLWDIVLKLFLVSFSSLLIICKVGGGWVRRRCLSNRNVYHYFSFLFSYFHSKMKDNIKNCVWHSSKETKWDGKVKGGSLTFSLFYVDELGKVGLYWIHPSLPTLKRHKETITLASRIFFKIQERNRTQDLIFCQTSK